MSHLNRDARAWWGELEAPSEPVRLGEHDGYWYRILRGNAAGVAAGDLSRIVPHGRPEYRPARPLFTETLGHDRRSLRAG